MWSSCVRMQPVVECSPLRRGLFSSGLSLPWLSFGHPSCGELCYCICLVCRACFALLFLLSPSWPSTHRTQLEPRWHLKLINTRRAVRYKIHIALGASRLVFYNTLSKLLPEFRLRSISEAFSARQLIWRGSAQLRFIEHKKPICEIGKLRIELMLGCCIAYNKWDSTV